MTLKLLFTGASAGIGENLARRFGEAGHEIWNWSRTPSKVPGIRNTSCDVSDFRQVDAAAREVENTWNSLDALICLAGIQGALGPTLEQDPALWEKTMAVNFHGTFHAIRATFPLLKRSARRPKLICFSGGGATSFRPFFSAYGASKTAIVRLVENLSEEWKLTGVIADIHAIAPGAIATRMTEEVLRQGPDRIGAKEFSEAGALIARGNIEESMTQVFKLVEFLLSDRSDGLSGRLISAVRDPWPEFSGKLQEIMNSEIYTLRRQT